MYKRHLLFFMLLLGVLQSRSQVTMSLLVPATGVVQKNQLWSMLLVSGGDNPVYAIVKLSLLSASDNQVMLTATSNRFLLSKGVNRVGVNEVSPVQYDYASGNFNIAAGAEGFLPAGNYIACYTVAVQQGDALSELAEQCIPVEVVPLAPPLLNTPFDRDTLDVAYPQFSWLPPAPLQLFNQLSYDLVVTEMLPGQSAEQAVQENIPVYSAGRLSQSDYMYPASGHALDSSTWYAWRIVARNNDQLVAQSEVWTFMIGSRADSVALPVASSYLLLKREGEAAGVNRIEGNRLLLKYYSYGAGIPVHLRITGSDGQLVRELDRSVVYGNNFLSVELDDSFEKGKSYIIRLTDQQHRTYRADFMIQSTH